MKVKLIFLKKTFLIVRLKKVEVSCVIEFQLIGCGYSGYGFNGFGINFI